MAIVFPPLKEAQMLSGDVRRLYIGAYGLETRSLGWCRNQSCKANLLSDAMVFQYVHPKGDNKILPLRHLLKERGAGKPKDIPFDYDSPQDIEKRLEINFSRITADEIVLDISAMAKILILASLCNLTKFDGTLRLVYSEAENYYPRQKDYNVAKRIMAATARFPSRGCGDIIRLKCLSSIRMQGQPITLVAFTSFNEKLVSHLLGYLTPHRLLLINGHPPRKDYGWREEATQYIHKKYWLEHYIDNPLGKDGLLKRATSTLYYEETFSAIEDIYARHGLFERIVCAATGSKMQTVGLFFSKIAHPDIQIDYPTPDSFVKGMSTGIRRVHELVIPRFSTFIKNVNG